MTEVFFYDNKSIPNSQSQTFYLHMKIYKLFLRNIPSAAQQELSRPGSRGTPHALRGVYLALYEKNETVHYSLVCMIYLVRESLCPFIFLLIFFNMNLGTGTYLAGATKSPTSMYSQSVKNQSLPASKCERLL